MTATQTLTRLRTPHSHVDRRAIILWSLRAGLGWASLAVPQLLALIVVSTPWQLAGLGVTALLGSAHTAVMPRWRYRQHRWEASDDAVFTVAGWLGLTWAVAPISRIQSLTTDRGPLERLLGLATVTITTASGAGRLEIEGLADGVAARLVADMTALTNATPGDAT